jgi:hypothetical protein
MRVGINEQRFFERCFADQEILDTRNHLVLRAMQLHDFEG